MHPFDEDKDRTVIENVRGSLLMLVFGLFTLFFLIAIDRPEWFNLRPASGTAAAMSKASGAPSYDQGGPRQVADMSGSRH